MIRFSEEISIAREGDGFVIITDEQTIFIEWDAGCALKDALDAIIKPEAEILPLVRGKA